MAGTPFEVDWTAVAVDGPQLLTWEGSGSAGATATTTYRLAAENGGTRFSYVVGPVDPRRRRVLDDRGREANVSALEILLAFVGFGVTAMVIAAMILLTPSGGVEVHTAGTDPKGSNLSPQPAPTTASTVDAPART